MLNSDNFFPFGSCSTRRRQCIISTSFTYPFYGNPHAYLRRRPQQHNCSCTGFYTFTQSTTFLMLLATIEVLGSLQWAGGVSRNNLVHIRTITLSDICRRVGAEQMSHTHLLYSWYDVYSSSCDAHKDKFRIREVKS